MIRLPIRATVVALAAATPLAAESLNVTVDGIRNANGNIVILVFDNARPFDTLDVWRAVDFAQVPSRTGSVSHEFADLKSGPYAVLLFHDENGDDDLNMTKTRFLEGIGASGAPKPTDDPDFQAASVWPGTVRVRVHYDR